MKLRLLVTGKTESEYLKTGILEYVTRVKRYVSFEIVEIPVLKNTSSLSVTEHKMKESVLIMKHIQPGDFLVLLDEHGKEMNSAGFAEFLNQRFLSGGKETVFLIGGPYGFDESFRKRADYILSLSKLTFPHQMVRLFFVEQLYRALTILRCESYHHK